jgi:diguanylate cyclase (GGDEF)-like protein/PAS domain S-box-containing protein
VIRLALFRSTPRGHAAPLDGAAAGGGRTRRALLRHVPLALWVSAVVVIPVAAAWALHSLSDDARERQLAATHLETLAADVNLATADLGWAAALSGTPNALNAREAREEHALRDELAVGSELDALRGEPTVSQAMLQVEPATRAFMQTLNAEVALLAADAAPGALQQTISAPQQHDALMTLIDGSAATLRSAADRASNLVSVGIWIVVIGESAVAGIVLWLLASWRRRAAVSRAQQRTLSESERTFRRLFEQNPLPTWISAPRDRRFLSVNRAAVETYGYKPDEFASMTTVDLLPAAERAEQRTPAGEMAGPTTTRSHLLKDGGRIDVEVFETWLDYRGTPAMLTVVRDVTDQRRLENELRDRAFHDSLTGLANRALFVDRFEHAQSARTPRDRGLGVIILDLDSFKTINDTLGHTVGDEVLCEVGARIQAAVRAHDTATRLGGDEFAVLVEASVARGTRQLAKRLLTTLSTPVHVAGTEIDISASIGVAMISDQSVTWERALHDADIAMYAAKAGGGACVRVYEPEMRSALLERMLTVRELCRALANGELVLHYQPIVQRSSDAWHVEHVEALVRWNHPTRGLVQPVDFIPVAEETGTIVAIGEWVLRTACEQVSAWLSQGRRLAVHVNVSGRQLREPDYTAMVLRIVAETGIPSDSLVLEVTETAILEDLAAAQLKLNELRRRGIRVALDDFGAGYSSLSYLSQLPVDIVKIDRVFIASLRNPDRLATLVTIMRLLDTMSVKTVAEGVETSEDLAYLMSLSIDSCQGYYFSEAVPGSEVPEAVGRCEQTDVPDESAAEPGDAAPAPEMARAS